MKKAVFMLAFVLASAVFSVCMNCCVRFPTTNPKIVECYMCTRTMAVLTVIGSFPQMMSDNPGDGGFMLENLILIPFIGLPFFCRYLSGGGCGHGVPSSGLLHRSCEGEGLT